MNLRISTILALIGTLNFAQSLTDDDYKDDFNLDDIVDNMIIYTSDHDIMKLLVPQNALNYDENHNLNKKLKKPIIFFVEADIDASGGFIDQGLYVLKDGKATKLLEHGRDVDASSDNSNLVFFGAQDGLYVYNPLTNSAEKYGPINDSIIGVAKEKTGDVIYILTENHELYKVSNNGGTKEKVEDVVNAQQIVIDNSNNIYFYTNDKQVFVRTADGLKKIEGLPEHITNITLFKRPSFTKNIAVSFIDNTVYGLYANGTSSHNNHKSDINGPIDFVFEKTMYYAVDKTIVETSIAEVRLLSVAADFDNLLTSLQSTIMAMIQSRTNAKDGRVQY